MQKCTYPGRPFGDEGFMTERDGAEVWPKMVEEPEVQRNRAIGLELNVGVSRINIGECGCSGCRHSPPFGPSPFGPFGPHSARKVGKGLKRAGLQTDRLPFKMPREIGSGVKV